MFVAALVIGLVAASEWARRLAIRGMCAASAEGAPDVGDVSPVRAATRVTRLATRTPRAVARHARRTEEADGIVPIPQWQRDP